MRKIFPHRQSAQAERLVPPSGDLDEFVAEVAAHRGRPIDLISVDVAVDAPSGLWISTDAADYIVYPQGVPASHRDAIVCHEIAHMLLGHGSAAGSAARTALARTAAPSLSAEIAERILRRHDYTDAHEVAAEALGTRLAATLAARAEQTRRRSDRIHDRLR